MTVQVVSKYSTNPIIMNSGEEVQEAFMSTFGIDLRKYGGVLFLIYHKKWMLKKLNRKYTQNHHRQPALPLHEW